MADLCKRGLHPDTPENTITETSGRRRCRACRNAYKRHAHVPRAREDQMGERNGNWAGGAAGYSAMHKRVVSLRGKAGHCERCGREDPARMYDWANLTGRYDDPEDYQQMCRPCHRRFDFERQGLTAFRSERNVRIMAARRSGRRLDDIAVEFQLTPQHVGQIVREGPQPAWTGSREFPYG